MDAANEGRAATRITVLAWAVLSAAALVPFVLASFPPLYDYYHWIFEGHVFASLAFGAGGEQSAAIADAYSIYWAPVPNMAATAGMGILDVALPPLVAGRVFAALTVLVFAAGFGFLVRSLQGRPTLLELLGFPWAFGFFLYKGYLSYELSLGIAFFALGVLHRRTGGGTRAPGRRASVALGALSVLLFLSHIAGWGVFVAATAAYAAASWRMDRKTAIRIAALGLPSLPPLLWYMVGSGGDRSIVYYSSWSDKLRALVEPWFLYVQADPVPPLFPTLAASALALLLLLALLATQRERGPERRSLRVVLGLAGFLVVAGLLLPVANLKGMIRPDQRLIFPAALLASSSIRWGRAGLSGTLVSAALVLLLLGMHALEYSRASLFLGAIDEKLETTLPPGAPGVSIAVILPRPGSGCAAEKGLGIGRTDTLRWFGLVHMLGATGVKVSLMSTSVIDKNFVHADLHDLQSVVKEPWELPDLAASAREYAGLYSYAEVFGCPNDVARVEAALAPHFEEVTSGPGFALLEPK